MNAATARLEEMIAVSDRLEELWAKTGSDKIAHELHDALESTRRAVRFAREDWSKESE